MMPKMWVVAVLVGLAGFGPLVQAQNALAVVDYADLVEKLSPAVVNISSQSKPHRVVVQRPAGAAAENPFAGTPFEGFWAPFFEDSTPHGDVSTQVRQSLGTGVIISADGYIVTNNHVIEDADAIVVKLNDNRHDFPAKVVGRDDKTDLALLKINTTAPLPVATLGQSERVRVGQAVLAIGNPFGLGGTVTSGIVSALARNIGQGPYDDFIQTDVAINPGNSGGPLFNVQGEVVGINTAIFSRSGGSNGISFAIPVDVVKQVVGQLKAQGRVSRGYLGVKVQLLTADLAEGVGLKEPVGALVAEVTEGSPAAKAGLKEGDVILKVNGKVVDEMNDLPKLVAAIPAGTRVPMEVLRNAKPVALKATVGVLPEEDMPHVETERDEEPRADGDDEAVRERLGLVITTVTPRVRAQRDMPAHVNGVMVLRANSTAQKAGLRAGDVIAEADFKPVVDGRSLKAALDKKEGRKLLLRVWREDGYLFVSLDVPARRP